MIVVVAMVVVVVVVVMIVVVDMAPGILGSCIARQSARGHGLVR